MKIVSCSLQGSDSVRSLKKRNECKVPMGDERIFLPECNDYHNQQMRSTKQGEMMAMVDGDAG